MLTYLKGLLDGTIKAVNNDEAEVVKVSSIKALQGYMTARAVPADRQVPIIASISEFLYAKDMTDLEESDDLLVTLVETLRAAIALDTRITISGDSGALDLLFVLAKHGASNFQLTMLVSEAFEEIVGEFNLPRCPAHSHMAESLRLDGAMIREVGS
jgi:hypothetical protein